MKKTGIILSISEARNILLNRQLTFSNDYKSPKKKLENIIEQIGYVQIDTISIVERAHKHILWTRMPEFENQMLDELIDKDRKVFEFWDHAAAYLPMKHFRHTLLRKEMYRKRHRNWEKKNRKLLKFVIDRIRDEGPLLSRDFEHPVKRGLWWDWKPTKDALEYLFHTGELMVKARKGFQKVYELTERMVSPAVLTSTPTEEEHSRHLVMKAINAGGIVTVSEMTYLRRHDPAITSSVINMMIEKKEIIPAGIHKSENEVYYTTPKILKQLNNRQTDKQIHILSPFDNIVIQRKRLKNLFDFDYTVECYVPAPKRKFGYFCLPLLHGNEFIGRLDAKADRKTGRFNIINIFWEKGMNKNKLSSSYSLIEEKIWELAKFSGCSEIISPESRL